MYCIISFSSHAYSPLAVVSSLSLRMDIHGIPYNKTLCRLHCGSFLVYTLSIQYCSSFRHNNGLQCDHTLPCIVWPTECDSRTKAGAGNPCTNIAHIVDVFRRERLHEMVSKSHPRMVQVSSCDRHACSPAPLAFPAPPQRATHRLSLWHHRLPNYHSFP